MTLTPYLCGLPIAKSGVSARKAAKLENSMEFANKFFNFVNLALDIFRWDGLPDTCDQRIIEKSFLFSGRAMIAEYQGALISPMAAAGANLTIYGLPLTMWGYGANGFNKEFKAYVPGADKGKTMTETAAGQVRPDLPECVWGRDNETCYPYISYIYMAASRLADIVRSCDVLIKNQKSPFIVACDEMQVKSVQDLFRNRDDNSPVIIGSKSLSGIDIKVLSLQIPPETLSQFWTQYRNIESELLETLGVNANNNADKTSGVNVLEVTSNDEAICANLAKRLKWRQKWADEVNAYFGLNIQPRVTRAEDYEEVKPDDMQDTADFGGVEGSQPDL